jgi:hypothetical protein
MHLKEFERGVEVRILTLCVDDIHVEPDDVKGDHGLEDVIDTHEIEWWDGMSPCEYDPNYSTFGRNSFSQMRFFWLYLFQGYLRVCGSGITPRRVHCYVSPVYVSGTNVGRPGLQALTSCREHD